MAYLDRDAVLSLTCTREGTCCHGKQVWINPWELARLAQARGLDPGRFRAAQTVDGGIRLAFSGPPGWRGLPACSQYQPGSGCAVHPARPLACRLYPLGRERQGEQVRFLHEGTEFPCLAGCPAVAGLAHLTVADYLAGQDTAAGEAAQDAYLGVVADLGEGAFVLVFDSGLAASGERSWIDAWRRVAEGSPRERATILGPQWLDRLTMPAIGPASDAPGPWIAAHRSALEEAAQSAFASCSDASGLRQASAVMLALALHLAQSLGADHRTLGRRWQAEARQRAGG